MYFKVFVKKKIGYMSLWFFMITQILTNLSTNQMDKFLIINNLKINLGDM